MEELEKSRTAFEMPVSVAKNIGYFTGRTWLLSPLLEWFEQSDARFFILTGVPGTGKSSVMAWLAGAGPVPSEDTAELQWKRFHARVGGVHFCIANSGTTAPRTFAENLANQLINNVEGFKEALEDSFKDQIRISGKAEATEVQAGGIVTGININHLSLSQVDEEQSIDNALRRPLKKLYKDGFNKPLLLLVDALDEATTYSGTNIVHLLYKLIDLPMQVRILATTRDDPRVLKYFPNARKVDLLNDAPIDTDDVRLFINEQLAQLHDRDQVKLVDQISKASKGNYLYAHLVLENFLQHLSNGAQISLPHGLEGIYQEFLNRELGVNENRWYDIFRPVLGLIAVARGGGLTTAQIEQITEREVELPLRTCKQYLDGELPLGPYRPFHQSFAQFLLENEGNVDYHIDAVKMHQKIADYYWNRYRFNWQNCDVYGLENLPTHLVEAKEWNKVAELLGDLAFLEITVKRLKEPGPVFDYLSPYILPIPEDIKMHDRKIYHLIENSYYEERGDGQTAAKNHLKAFANCLTLFYSENVGTLDKQARCSSCGECTIIHGHVDKGAVDYHDYYISWCMTCFWCWFVYEFDLWGTDYEAWREFDYGDNTYVTVPISSGSTFPSRF